MLAANHAEEGSVPVSAAKIPERTRLRQTHADLEQSRAGSSAGTRDCLLAQVPRHALTILCLSPALWYLFQPLLFAMIMLNSSHTNPLQLCLLPGAVAVD